MPDLQALSREVIEGSYLFCLGTNDEEGPWQAYLFYVADEQFTIYWLSNPATRHSKALEKNSKTSAVFLASDVKDHEKALQMAGIAKIIATPPQAILDAYAKKRSPDGSYDFAATLAKGFSWYSFTPTFIGLMHSEHFGFKRQTVLG